jgi:3-hydroxyacyl-[acyl-carrier-protein] dehydratase
MVANIALNKKTMYEDILEYVPYKSGFRFIDQITYLDDKEVKGRYTLKENEFFYADHFPGYPVTPGVILTEIMAQIGLVVLGIYLVQQSTSQQEEKPALSLFPLMTAADAQFYKMVMPKETLIVESKKIYFRLSKLKCQVQMFDIHGSIVARAVLSGILKSNMASNL